MMTLLRNGMAFLRKSLSRADLSACLAHIAPKMASRRKPGSTHPHPGCCRSGSRLSPGRQFVLAVRADEVADQGVGLALPAAAVEDAVMADAELQMVQLFGVRQVMAQALRGDGLAGAANIVALAFDRHQRGALDRAGIDRLAMHLKAAIRQIVALKHAVEGLQIE